MVPDKKKSKVKSTKEPELELEFIRGSNLDGLVSLSNVKLLTFDLDSILITTSIA